MKQKITRGKLEHNIFEKFERVYDLEAHADNKKSFEIEFTINENGNQLKFLVPIELNEPSIYKRDLIFCERNGKEIELVIVGMNLNPNAETLGQKIDKLMDQRSEEQIEADEDWKDMQLTYESLKYQ